MTTFYCPKCWGEMKEDLKICPHCGADIPKIWASFSYEDKLIHALGHPEPTTVMRSAWLLGEKKVEKAVPALIELIKSTRDIYITLEATRALGKINTPDCRQALSDLTHHPVRMISREARMILKGFQDIPPKPGQ